MHSTSRPTCPSSTSLIVTTAVMTPSVLGHTQTDQSVQRASGTGSEGEGRLGPLLNQQQTQRTHPTRPPTSALRGWPHWVTDFVFFGIGRLVTAPDFSHAATRSDPIPQSPNTSRLCSPGSGGLRSTDAGDLLNRGAGAGCGSPSISAKRLRARLCGCTGASSPSKSGETHHLRPPAAASHS